MARRQLDLCALGLYAGFFMSLEALLKRPMGALMRKLGVNVDGKAMTALRVVGMYFILIPAAAIFRANDVSHAGMLLSTMLTDFGFSSEYLSAAMANLGLDWQSVLILTVFTVCEVMIWHYGEIGRYKKVAQPDDRRGRSLAAERSVIFVYIVAAVALCWLALMASDSVSAFQYFQF
nr:hypothetical protein [Clostridia bacterium]